MLQICILKIRYITPFTFITFTQTLQAEEPVGTTNWIPLLSISTFVLLSSAITLFFTLSPKQKAKRKAKRKKPNPPKPAFPAS